MFPIITLIGRRNVGKSTLFNRLTRTSDALVGISNLGLTRDRRYGSFKWENHQFIIVDTGGIESNRDELDVSVFDQSMQSVLEADLILFVVDGKVGLMPGDREIVHYLYKSQRSIFIVVNKIDHPTLGDLKFDFFSLGIKKIFFVSAVHGHGMQFLLNKIIFQFYNKEFPSKHSFLYEDEQLKIFLKNPSSFLKGKGLGIIRLAVVGAPNVGKSTFINYVLGEKRIVVSSIPGTTRDSICVSMIYNDYKWILVDTAGIRKQNKISSDTERMSIMNTLEIMKDVTVVLFLINASSGIRSYDLSLLNSILRSGKSLVVGINKCDLLSDKLREKFKIMCNKRMHFIPFINKNFISSLSGEGVHCLLNSIIEAHCASFKFFSTSCLTRIMRLAVDKQPPPLLNHGKRIKLKYAHMGGYVPFIVVIHGNYVTKLPGHYKRYLGNYFSHLLEISSLSIYMRFKEDN